MLLWRKTTWLALLPITAEANSLSLLCTCACFFLFWFLSNSIIDSGSLIGYIWLLKQLTAKKRLCLGAVQVWCNQLKEMGQIITLEGGRGHLLFICPGGFACATRGGISNKCWPLLLFFLLLSLLCLLLLTHFGESPVCENLFPPIFWYNKKIYAKRKKN